MQPHAGPTSQRPTRIAGILAAMQWAPSAIFVGKHARLFRTLATFLALSVVSLSCGERTPEVVVPQWEPADAPPKLLALNTAVGELATDLSTTQSPVIAVDHFTGFDAIDDTYDGVHPTRRGEEKLAETWATALRPHLAKSGDPRKVLLLGDSITDNHYRTILWSLLATDGYAFDLVGTQHGFPLAVDPKELAVDGTSFDSDHEGHTGWTARELLDGSLWDPDGGGGLDDWLSGYDPDIVALHIGTNDLIIGELSADEIASDIGEVIGRLREDNADVTVLVAQIIPYLPWDEPDAESTGD